MQIMLTKEEYDKLVPQSNSRFAAIFKTPLAKEYEELGSKLVLFANNPTTASELIQQDADINFIEPTPFGYVTPLIHKVLNHNVDMIKFLLNAGANPYIKSPSLGMSGLINATALDLTIWLLNQENKRASKHKNQKKIEQLETIKVLLEEAMQQ